MNIAEKDKLINKNVDKAAKRMLRITVSTSAVFVVAYQFVLLRWEAPCKEVFNLGVLCNTIALSIVTAYIFYYITTVIPQKQKLKAMKPVVEQSKLDLAASLKMLFNLLTKDEQWSDLDNDTLKANFNASSKERRIWLEECSGIFKTPEVFLLYNPYTLTVISYILTDIQREIDSILQNSQFFDSEYLTRII